MDTHKNAPLTPKGREAMVRSVIDGGLSEAAAARQFNTTPKTVAKWVARFRAEGVAGLRDRSSRPPPFSWLLRRLRNVLSYHSFTDRRRGSDRASSAFNGSSMIIMSAPRP